MCWRRFAAIAALFGCVYFSLQMPEFKSSAINLVMFMEWWVLLKLSQHHKSHHAQLYRGCLPLHLTGVKLRECRPIQGTPIFSSVNIIAILDLLLQRHVRWLYEQACIFLLILNVRVGFSKRLWRIYCLLLLVAWSYFCLFGAIWLSLRQGSWRLHST